uniref:Uncharacterized protein n=1 Tax=Sus scrofa TaxID=9823 RepID=A0A8D0QPY3_PIG
MPKTSAVGVRGGHRRWVLGTTSMALAEWRVWYVNSTSLLSSRLACVGVWRACIFHHGNGLDCPIGCQDYSYLDSSVPLDIRVAQIVLLLATVLGLFSKAAIIFALKNMYLSKAQKTCGPSAVAGMLSIAASVCILAAVVWNQLSIQTEEGIAFPPSFNLPFKSDCQEVGGAALMAFLGSFGFFFGGWLTSLTNTC